MTFAGRLVAALCPTLQLSGLAAVIAYGFGGTTLQRLESLPPFLRCHWLMEDNTQAEFVITPEGRGRGFPAEVAVDAGAVHVERAGDAAGILLISIRHSFNREPGSFPASR